MSSKVQSLDTIGPMDQAQTAKISDPVQKEYEEGKQHFENQSYGQAAVALHNALIGFEEKNDENGIANASNQLGHVCVVRDDLESALKHYSRALDICDKSNDRMSILAVLKKMAEVYRNLKQYSVALETSLKILDHYQDNRDPQGTVITLEEIAETYIACGEKAKAADTYRTISSIHKNFKHENIAKSYMEKAVQLDSEA